MMGVIKALIKIIIITIQIGILLKLALPLATALPIPEVIPTNSITETDNIQPRMFMPPKFPYSAPFGYHSSGLLCLFTDTPYVGGWFGRSCQGPIPPFQLPTPPPSSTPEPTDPLRVPGKMNFLEGYYGFPWSTPSPPTTFTVRPPPTPPTGNNTSTTVQPNTETSTIGVLGQQPLLPNGLYYQHPHPLFSNMNTFPWVTPPPPSTVRPPIRPRPRPTISTTTSTTTTTTSTTTTSSTTTRTTTTTKPTTPSTTTVPPTELPYNHQYYPFPFFTFMPGFYQTHNPGEYDYGEPVEGNPWEPDDEKYFIENYGIKAANPGFKLGDPHG